MHVRTFVPCFAYSPLLVALLMIAPPGAGAQPKLSVDGGTQFDLGRVYRGSVIERKLTLKNTGTDTLRLGRVDVSCGCTGTVVAKDRIAPGASGTLLITFNSKNFAGTVHKSVTVNSNAEDGGHTVIEFTANVIDEIALNPKHLFFQNAEVKRASVVTLTVTNNGTLPLSLLGYRTPMKGLLLTLPSEPIPAGATAEIKAEFTPIAPAPVITEGVFVVTSNERQPEIYIQVFGSAREFKFE